MFKVSSSLQKGFTLIELMLVVGMVAIMAAIAIAQYDLYRRKANDTVAIADLMNARTAMEAFIASVPTIASPISIEISPAGTASIGGGYTLSQALPGYVHTSNVKILLNRDANNLITADASHCFGSSAGVGHDLPRILGLETLLKA